MTTVQADFERGTITMARRRPDGWLIEFEQHPDGRRAYHLTQNHERVRVPSVTTVIKQIHPAQALVRWAEAKGAEGAVIVGRQGKLRGVEAADAIEVVRAENAGADGASKRATHRGLELHAVLERYARNGDVPNPIEFPEQWRGYIRGLVRWLLHAEPEPTQVEQLVAHRALRYAGRFDLRALIKGSDSIVDLKTRERARVYFDDLLQVAGYDLGDIDCGSEPAEARVVIAIGADGEFVEEFAPEALRDAFSMGMVWRNSVEPLRAQFDNGQRAAT
jgi:hypothetical protein